MAGRDPGFLLQRIAHDPVLRSLPYAAQMVWVRLTFAMVQLGSSVLRIGAHVPDEAEISAFACIPVAETSMHLPTLERCGMLSRSADGALVNPAIVATERRAASARLNGMKGGRPRKRPVPTLRPLPLSMEVG